MVELVQDGDAGGELQTDDVVVGDAFDVLDHGAEGVAVGGDDDVLALLDEGEDLLVVVGPDAFGGELETLASGRGDVVGSAPDVHLVLAPLLARVVLVEPAQLAVVALVERLVLVDRDPLLTNLLELDAQRSLSALQSRREGNIKLDARGRNPLGSRQRFFAPQLRESRVLPTSEQVELVPLGLAVTCEDEGSNHFDERFDRVCVGGVGVGVGVGREG